MSFIGFEVVDSIKEKKVKEFLEKNQDNLEKCEYLIPDVLFEAIDDKFATCEVIRTTATWYGVTYKEDTPEVRKSIKELIDKGEYPLNLWED